MKTIEIIIIIVMTLVGFGILVLVMGLETAFFMAGAVIGCWLLFTGLGIIGDLLKRKIIEAQKAGMQPVLCVGEGLEEHEAGDAETVIERQLREALDQDNVLPGVIVSYEPVWAIGSGKIPSVKTIEQMHKKIRTIVTELGNPPEAVLYGGSVKPGNVKDLLASPEIDGVLVGGASLKVASFWKICQS